MPTILTSPNQDETLTNKTHNLEVLGSSPRGSAKEKELRSIRNSFFIFISLFLQADTKLEDLQTLKFTIFAS